METKKELFDPMDKLIQEALQTPPEFTIPPSFTDKLVAKVGKRIVFNEIFMEFSLKIGLVLGALAILVLFLLFPFPTRETTSPVFDFIGNYWQIASSVVIVIFFTYFFDQVFMRFIFRRSR